MFEGNPPRPADSRPLDTERESSVLRELTWAELVSRLAASRCMRPPFREDAGDASFDAGSARRIAAHHQGKEFLNSDDLSDSKEAAGTGTGVLPEYPVPRGCE